MQGRKNQGSRGLSPQFWHEKKQNPFLQKAFGYYIPPLIFLPFYGPAMALVEYIALCPLELFCVVKYIALYVLELSGVVNYIALCSLELLFCMVK